MEYFEAGGARMPRIGLGTYDMHGAGAIEAVRYGLELGYRHVDAARMYANEKDVGAGIAASGVPRDQIFITTKVWYTELQRDKLLRSAEASVKDLGCGVADLLLIHWPAPGMAISEMVASVNDAVDAGLARHIGVSNFTPAMIREAQAVTRHPLITNQVEFHPFFRQEPLRALLAEKGMALTAYQPLARGATQGNPVLEEIGRAHGKTASQVALRWLTQQDNVLAIPKSATPARIRENLEIFDFRLSADEMARIAALGRDDGRRIDAPFPFKWD
ncbi:aldo/keto reductase [Radicibacter daui]|uniref:aldo/keto reductase n=1 Tax=Radicibacter daui TaxID=3064829 RepID=UPI00404693BA